MRPPALGTGCCFLLRALAVVSVGVEAIRPVAAQHGANAIRLNQVGFHPASPKTVVVAAGQSDRFAVLDATTGDTVYRGRLGPAQTWALSGELVRRGEFTALARPGRYVVAVPEIGRSYPFSIDAAVLRDIALGAVKAFYFQRASVPLPPQYAGPWSRAAGHPDTAVLIHPSAAGPRRTSGTRVRSPGGWYDAGDYNKYIVNSGISTYTLLLFAEQYETWARELRTNIPESDNTLPDILDEALWNLRWMLTMQDPDDGGVYHKLTNAEFDPFIAPALATAPRFVVAKTTAASLDFAAVCAHAAIVVRNYPAVLPHVADSLVRAALGAWTWAERHPNEVYDQAALNRRFAPAIKTGEYGDRVLSDEREWAAAELFLATREQRFLVAAMPLAAVEADVPSWSAVRTLGLYSLVEHRRELPPAADTTRLKQRLLGLADGLLARAREGAYGVPIGGPGDFVWGSNGVAANQGMALIQAYRLTGDTAYRSAAASALDYLLGRNATGYSFVTGFGAKTPQQPHHRPSAADTVAAPVPGFLVGGANPGQQDHCGGYPSRLPARSYLDDVCSYASNEVAINWNAPFAYLAGAIAAAFPQR